MSTFVSQKPDVEEIDGKWLDIAGSRINVQVRVCIEEESAYLTTEQAKNMMGALDAAIRYAERL